MKTVKFYTLGCKVNQYDTQSIRERFINAGFREIFNGRKADFYFINTCTVTHKADKDSRYYIHKAHHQNPQARIIVTGCMVERDRAFLSGLNSVDYIISKRFFPDGIKGFSGHTRAFLKIQDGCDNFCSYCIVPLARGRSRSRDLEEVVSEAKILVKNGFKEIVLTGICLGRYGRDLNPRLSLTDVIEALEKIGGLLRIRLSSIEAGDISDKLIDKMAQSKRLCPHLHIPIQSGDDEILKRMNRNYCRADYFSLINKIRKKIPEIAITTDVLVGFPGESEENFRNTIGLVKEILPLRVHIFPYSPRTGTPAFNLGSRIATSIIKKRIGCLRKVSQTCSWKYRKQFLNKKIEVLIERSSTDNPNLWEGHAGNYMRVLFKSNSCLKNQVISLKLKEIAKDFTSADIY